MNVYKDICERLIDYWEDYMTDTTGNPIEAAADVLSRIDVLVEEAKDAKDDD